MSEENLAPNPEPGDDIVLLTGAGASKYLHLPGLDAALDNHTHGANSETIQLIQQTRNAIEACAGRYGRALFEELIGQLRSYLDAAIMLRTDNTFANELGILLPQVTTGVFDRKWKDALTECYRILLSEYGPENIKTEADEFQTTVRMLGDLARKNSGRLHVYTTNYDCSYQVMSSCCDNLRFCSHIDPEDNVFKEKWYISRPDLQESHLPLIYLNRLHGCVTWFTIDNNVPFHVEDEWEISEHDPDHLNRMCIKLVSSQVLGVNHALRLAFQEFSNHLKVAKCLFVWGHSFRDAEVLRKINNAFPLRVDPFEIRYLDPYLPERKALRNIQRTLRAVLVETHSSFRPKQIKWVPADGHDKLLEAVNESLGES